MASANLLKFIQQSGKQHEINESITQTIRQLKVGDFVEIATGNHCWWRTLAQDLGIKIRINKLNERRSMVTRTQ